MPIRLHISLLFLANIVALLGGFMLGMSIHETIQSSLPDLLQDKTVVFLVFGMLPAALCPFITGLVFRYLIAGRCPKCGGRAIYHPSRTEKAIFGGKNQIPITYHCQTCGYIHRTQIFPASPIEPH